MHPARNKATAYSRKGGPQKAALVKSRKILYFICFASQTRAGPKNFAWQPTMPAWLHLPQVVHTLLQTSTSLWAGTVALSTCVAAIGCVLHVVLRSPNDACSCVSIVVFLRKLHLECVVSVLHVRCYHRARTRTQQHTRSQQRVRLRRCAHKQQYVHYLVPMEPSRHNTRPQ